MKISVRTKFSMGITFFFFIIIVISVLSAYYLNQLSKKTNAILKENHYSVIYARDMTERLTNINLEITNCILTNKKWDNQFIEKELVLFDKALNLEKNNITEPGEDKLATEIELNFKEYKDSLLKFMASPMFISNILYQQNKTVLLNQKLLLLSQMNEHAIEVKTNDAKASSKNALARMSIFGTLCLLIALSFTYNFASYFNEKFYQLYKGIKEIASSNYGHRLHFEGKDEFQEISLVFNEMAEKLNEREEKMNLPLKVDLELEKHNDVNELRRLLDHFKTIEGQALNLISKIENKN